MHLLQQFSRPGIRLQLLEREPTGELAGVLEGLLHSQPGQMEIRLLPETDRPPWLHRGHWVTVQVNATRVGLRSATEKLEERGLATTWQGFRGVSATMQRY